MIYVNNIDITSENELDIISTIKAFLTKEKMILVNEENLPIDNKDLEEIVLNMEENLFLNAIHTNSIIRDFVVELKEYVSKVEEYVENVRDTEDFSTVTDSFINITEALLEFSTVAIFLQKELVDQIQLKELTNRSLIGAESGNLEYVLDIIEYELLPILHRILNEINEEM